MASCGLLDLRLNRPLRWTTRLTSAVNGVRIDLATRARKRAGLTYEEDMVRVHCKPGVAMAATLVLLGGCGGSSSSSSSSSSATPASSTSASTTSASSTPDQTASFKTGFGTVASQLQQTSHSIGVAIQHAAGRTDAQLATTFRGLATRWQSELSQLETLKPPPSLAATFNTVTGAATRAEADLNAIVSAAETHSKAAAEQASASLVSDILSTKAAGTKITTKLGIK